jgi:hypothetical protein
MPVKNKETVKLLGAQQICLHKRHMNGAATNPISVLAKGHS